MDSPDVQLSRLLAKYPLPCGSGRPECFGEKLEVEDFRIEMIGLVAETGPGQKVYGSAAGTSPLLAERAYFEMLERLAIVKAESSRRKHFTLFDQARNKLGLIAHREVFPKSPASKLWRFAKSNGVAAHLTWERACEAALMELVERDSLLRSWFVESQPVRLDFPMPELPVAVRRRYRIYAVSFETRELVTKAFITGIFGFPDEPGVPRLCGFGAGHELQSALNHAVTEALQSLAFLWGEQSGELLAYAPDPEFHQSFFLSPPGLSYLEDWIRGNHFHGRTVQAPPGRVKYVDLTPRELKGRAFVVKAIGEHFVPLTFGRCALFAPKGFPEERLIHPIA